ncbi:undecaprenyl-diphosphate phosphatase [Effusibacillus consociatus]|uniref:Undecaprenyl-diphosphatase n=1 Tax=Effusibacillus consociatus TaxID=1117041 RepID=A0ABV9Q440_9BACL
MEEFLKAIVLGIVQGLTEFLPISSTGHLLIGRKLLGLEEAGLFLDTMLHLGTLLAVVAIFWRDVLFMVRNPFSRLTLLILAGTIPTAAIGLAFEDYFEAISKTGVTVGWEFLLTGIILWWADNMKNGSKKIDQISYTDALLVGALQGAAILPAISRSGLTIAGALFRGIDKQAAARFSFLLSLPAILGAVVLQSKKLIDGEVAETISVFPLIAGTLASAVAGYIAVKWMLNILQRGSLKGFSIYVWVLGAIILFLQFTGKW